MLALLARFKYVILGVFGFIALSALVACYSNNVPTHTTDPITLPSISTKTATLYASPTNSSPYAIHISSKAPFGNYLTDPRGKTLYYTVSDQPGYSNLPDETLSSWPVFYVENITVPPSLNPAAFGTYHRDNSVKQTTYKGYPLYYFFQDIKAGDIYGNKQNGVWFIINPDNFPGQQ